MRDMILHHQQAIALARLVPSRSSRDNIKALAERIDASQIGEINRMRRWLAARGDSVGSSQEHTAHTGAHVRMPGMLTQQELAQLTNATGADFERMFLQFMIRHHEGALAMVQKLFATPANVRDPVLYQLANSIDADQRAEIVRMKILLKDLP